MVQYKDCIASCDPAVDGDGCNDGLNQVSAKFSTGKVSSCFQCEFVQSLDGTINGLKTCGDEITNLNIPRYNCPMYSDSSCYWAASFHKDAVFRTY